MHCYSSTFDKGQKQEVNGNRSTQPRPLLLPFLPPKTLWPFLIG